MSVAYIDAFVEMNDDDDDIACKNKQYIPRQRAIQMSIIPKLQCDLGAIARNKINMKGKRTSHKVVELSLSFKWSVATTKLNQFGYR